MKKSILILVFLPLSLYLSGQSLNTGLNSIDTADFHKKFNDVQWLCQYDAVAWWTSDSLIMSDKNELERLGKEWFCFQDNKNIWHAVYGKLYADSYDLVFHYVIEKDLTVRRIKDKVDEKLLLSYSRALVTANSLADNFRDTLSFKFNQFIRRNNDSTFTVWILPAIQTDKTCVSGIELIYRIDKTGNKLLETNNYIGNQIYKYSADRKNAARLQYTELVSPTLGGIYFVWYYKSYFQKIILDLKNTGLTVYKASDNNYYWLNTDK